ncbi:3'-5' exonuclease [Corynebacterium tapiri]|uniref:3'-5' exonuclease n=1 Tax=Corynebacterium tapiri TaxID=1448266 RepID=A0A5C4U665_9CORY|nr:3'-5' exonuclease [Corynebacterium tapiri]TNL99763.1 3'-5' exonuclease [Corynebacterium tapiri]
MSSFDASRMLSFDLETTSVNPKEARIVTSALITIAGASSDTVEMLANPGVEIPQAAIDVHGITNEKAQAEGREHSEVLDETISRIRRGWEEGFTLIVFNAAYDLSVLHALTNGEFTVTGPVFDPFVVDRWKDPYRKGRRTLGNVCEHYRVTLGNAHEASADALAAARVAWKQVNQMWPELKQLDTDELMEQQAVGYYDMQTRLHKYLSSRGKDASTVNFSWPMHS